MKREIKFRAFVFGRMGEPFNPLDRVFISCFGTFPDETIFMQYTGLKDENGKEIYEGDVVKFEGDSGVVKYYDGAFVIGNEEMDLLHVKYPVTKIIGNVYENPELLKA